MRIKKITIGVLVFFQLMSSCALQKTHKTKTGLHGQVESRSSFIYSQVIEKSGEIEPVSSKARHSFTRFNQDGLLMEEIKYSSDNSIRSLKLYEYDENENKIEEREYYNSGNLRFKSIYIYSNEGRNVEVKYWNYQYNGDYVSNVKTLKHNNNGNLIEFIHVSKKIIYKYDDRNNLIEELSFHPNDSLFSKITYMYGKFGANEMIVNNSDDTSRNGRTLFKRDSHGNIIEVVRYDVDGKLGINTTNVFEYDKRGNIIKYIEYQDGAPRFMSITKYKYFD